MEENNNVVGAPEDPLGVKMQDPNEILNNLGNVSYNGETAEKIPEDQAEVVDNNNVPIPEEPSDPFKKLATARLIFDGSKTAFRFDVYFSGDEKSKGTIELRNTVNAFESIRPDKEKDYKEFFAMYGIMIWNFSRNTMAVNTNVLSSLTSIETLVNDHIKLAGIKRDKFNFIIDFVEEE